MRDRTNGSTSSSAERNSPEHFNDILNTQDMEDNLFIKYKNLSLGKNGLKAMKSSEQIRDDKAVHIFFSKLIA